MYKYRSRRSRSRCPWSARVIGLVFLCSRCDRVFKRGGRMHSRMRAGVEIYNSSVGRSVAIVCRSLGFHARCALDRLACRALPLPKHLADADGTTRPTKAYPCHERTHGRTLGVRSANYLGFSARRLPDSPRLS